MIMRAAVLGVLILILIGSIALVSAQVRRSKAKKAEEKAKQEKLIQEEEAKNKQRRFVRFIACDLRHDIRIFVIIIQRF